MTFQQQKRFILFWVVIPTLILCAFLSRWVYGQECVQSYVDPPAWADPNMIDGILLPPFPGDPNVWEVRAGFYGRDPAPACDPDGDAFKIDFDPNGCTSLPTIIHNPVEGWWSFTAILGPGINKFVFIADDGLDAQRYTALIKTVENNRPVLK